MSQPICGRVAIVVAHPDDEVLWFGSVVPRATTTIVCFSRDPNDPKISEGRTRAIAALRNQRTEFIGLSEAGVFDCASWRKPEVVEWGMRLSGGLRKPDEMTTAQYSNNYAKIVDDLRKRLAGMDVVFTHNPWGEYGHEEHVQVFLAVLKLQSELHFRIMFSTYVSNRSQAACLMSKHLVGGEWYSLPVDNKFVAGRQQIYIDCGCWTWQREYRWPAFEWFVGCRMDASQRIGDLDGRLMYLRLESTRKSRWWGRWSEFLSDIGQAGW